MYTSFSKGSLKSPLLDSQNYRGPDVIVHKNSGQIYGKTAGIQVIFSTAEHHFLGIC